MRCRHDQGCGTEMTEPDAVGAGCGLARDLQLSGCSTLGIKRTLTPVSMAMK